jgi:hypothetical protein
MPMEALAVDLQLLRQIMLPELKLAVGRTLMARVAALEANGRGTISLAGVMLDAQLPKGLRVGQEIRLQVREITPDKVVLGLQDRPAVLAQPVAMPLPGGGAIEVRERHESSGGSGGGGAGGSGVHTLAITYDAPALGPVDMRFALDPATLRLQLTVAAGAAFDAAHAASEDLSQALSGVLDRSISVSVQSRYEPVDVYA